MPQIAVWLKYGINDLTPLTGLAQLQILSFNNTQIKELMALENLSELSTVWAQGLGVTDWSPLDHVDGVKGRPNDWVRKVKKLPDP